MRQTFTVNNVDYSAVINKYHYRVGYDRRTGPNGGTMRDGSETEDFLATKAVITCETNGLKNATLAPLLTVLTGSQVQVTFDDPRANVQRTAVFRPEVSEAETTIYHPGGTRIYAAVAIRLTEV